MRQVARVAVGEFDLYALMLTPRLRAHILRDVERSGKRN